MTKTKTRAQQLRDEAVKQVEERRLRNMEAAKAVKEGLVQGDDTLITKIEEALGPTSNIETANSKRVAPFRTSFFRDTVLEFPDLFLEVHIQGEPGDDSRFAKMFSRGRCTKAKDPLSADLVVFGGGADVDPALYGEKPHPNTVCDPKRDELDMKLYETCLTEGIPMLGICRGAQFLHVMNGGKLYQHVDNHLRGHDLFDMVNKVRLHHVSSVHHQMVRPNTNGGMDVIATSLGVAKERWHNPVEVTKGSMPDIEAFFYRDTCCLGIQGHPEYSGYNMYMKWALELVKQYCIENVDIRTINSNYRLRPEMMAERDATWLRNVGTNEHATEMN